MQKVRAIALATAKLHLRVEHSQEDNYITLLASAAMQHVINSCSDLEADTVTTGNDPTPTPVQQAMLLHIGYFYENREDSGMNANTERSTTALLRAYRTHGYVAPVTE